jgi:hypothetical protein
MIRIAIAAVMITIALITVFISPAPKSEDTCPDGWVRVDGPAVCEVAPTN